MSILQLNNCSNGSDLKSPEPQNLSPRADKRGQSDMTARNRTLRRILSPADPPHPISKLVERKAVTKTRHVPEKVLLHQTPLCKSSLLSPIQVFPLHPDLRFSKRGC